MSAVSKKKQPDAESIQEYKKWVTPLYSHSVENWNKVFTDFDNVVVPNGGLTKSAMWSGINLVLANKGTTPKNGSITGPMLVEFGSRYAPVCSPQGISSGMNMFGIKPAQGQPPVTMQDYLFSPKYRKNLQGRTMSFSLSNNPEMINLCAYIDEVGKDVMRKLAPDLAIDEHFVPLVSKGYVSMHITEDPEITWLDPEIKKKLDRQAMDALPTDADGNPILPAPPKKDAPKKTYSVVQKIVDWQDDEKTPITENVRDARPYIVVIDPTKEEKKGPHHAIVRFKVDSVGTRRAPSWGVKIVIVSVQFCEPPKRIDVADIQSTPADASSFFSNRSAPPAPSVKAEVLDDFNRVRDAKRPSSEITATAAPPYPGLDTLPMDDDDFFNKMEEQAFQTRSNQQAASQANTAAVASVSPPYPVANVSLLPEQQTFAHESPQIDPTLLIKQEPTDSSPPLVIASSE